jgi:hypothetical protein
MSSCPINHPGPEEVNEERSTGENNNIQDGEPIDNNNMANQQILNDGGGGVLDNHNNNQPIEVFAEQEEANELPLGYEVTIDDILDSVVSANTLQAYVGDISHFLQWVLINEDTWLTDNGREKLVNIFVQREIVPIAEILGRVVLLNLRQKCNKFNFSNLAHSFASFA